MNDQNVKERDVVVLLRSAHKVNEPWLEKQALLLEEALIEKCAGMILGPSVSANFHENGWELDLTIQAGSLSEAYDKIGKALAVVEETASISLGADEIRSDYVSPDAHEHDAVLVG
jgi:hypothetical protein